MLSVDQTEVPLPRSEHHGNNVKGHLVHQTKVEGLTADVARRNGDRAFSGELTCLRDRLSHVVDEVVGGLRMPAVWFRPMGHDNHMVVR